MEKSPIRPERYPVGVADWRTLGGPPRPIPVVPDLSQAVSAMGSLQRDDEDRGPALATPGLQQILEQAAQVPSSQVTCNSPRRPWRNCGMQLALVSMTDSITTFPPSFRQAATHCPCIVIFTRSLSLSALLWPSGAGSSQMSELGDRSRAS